MKRIVILGGGTGGTLAANRLRRTYDPEAAEIVVVDRDDRHVYQPGLLFVPFGQADVTRLTRPRRRPAGWPGRPSQPGRPSLPDRPGRDPGTPGRAPSSRRWR